MQSLLQTCRNKEMDVQFFSISHSYLAVSQSLGQSYWGGKKISKLVFKRLFTCSLQVMCVAMKSLLCFSEYLFIFSSPHIRTEDGS